MQGKFGVPCPSYSAVYSYITSCVFFLNLFIYFNYSVRNFTTVKRRYTTRRVVYISIAKGNDVTRIERSRSYIGSSRMYTDAAMVYNEY